MNSGHEYEIRLVERFRHGDSEAAATLFEMYVDHMYRYAQHVLGNREDAEEVASEAFLKAFRHIADFRGESSFKSWLFGILRNLCRDRLRQTRLFIVSIDDHFDLSVDQGPERAFEIQTDVRNAMSKLPDDYQDILILCDVEEWNAAEAADLLGKTIQATKSQLYRARRLLREKLQQQWEGQ